MPASLATCIYCPATFGPRAGDGDHIFPAALGEFSGLETFRGSCPKCNNLIGRSEEELIRCGPESYLSRISDPPRRRGRRSKAWPSAQTAPAPSMSMQRFGAKFLVRPTIRDPRFLEAPNQIVIENEQGEKFPILVLRGMSARTLRKKIDALNIVGKFHVQSWADEEHWDWMNEILEELWPNSNREEMPPMEVGVTSGFGPIHFNVTDHYFRSLAKMAFHYYLQYNCSSVRGDESEFAAIREFIMKGGDFQQFFKPDSEFTPIVPRVFGEQRGDLIGCPPQWMHILAADDSGPKARAFLHLFLGKGYVPDPYNIVLGDRPASSAGTGAWSHVLTWEPGAKGKGKAEPFMANTTSESALRRFIGAR